jgi:hypothetical protein
MLMHHDHVSTPVCTISILWNFHTNPYHPSKNYELKQQGDGAGETSIATNYELQDTGWATRAPVAQTLQRVRQTCPCTTTCPHIWYDFVLFFRVKPHSFSLIGFSAG